MSAKLCKPVLKLLVQEIDKAAFRAEANFGTVLSAVISSHPEITASEEEWNKLNEDTRNSIIDRAKQTLGSIG
jgi:hypothetical protein